MSGRWRRVLEHPLATLRADFRGGHVYAHTRAPRACCPPPPPPGRVAILGNHYTDGGEVQFYAQALGCVLGENSFTRTGGFSSWGACTPVPPVPHSHRSVGRGSAVLAPCGAVWSTETTLRFDVQRGRRAHRTRWHTLRYTPGCVAPLCPLSLAPKSCAVGRASSMWQGARSPSTRT